MLGFLTFSNTCLEIQPPTIKILRTSYTSYTLRNPFHALPFPLLVLPKALSNTFNTSNMRSQACAVVVLPYAYTGCKISSVINALIR